MDYNENLTDRVRAALAHLPDVEEKNMFGSLAFMIHGKLAVTVNNDGRLMLRCDPEKSDELVSREGADWAEMKEQKMGKSWIIVDARGTESENDFRCWIQEALIYNKDIRSDK